MSAVPGSLKVTRCVRSRRAFSRASSTPSAPASAGRHRGAAHRSRAMESASGISVAAPAHQACSGSGPYRFGPVVPRRKPSSTRPQIANARAAEAHRHRDRRIVESSPECRRGRSGRARTAEIHQPLLSRSCSRLMPVANAGPRDATTKNEARQPDQQCRPPKLEQSRSVFEPITDDADADESDPGDRIDQEWRASICRD